MTIYSYQPFLEAFEALSRIKETRKYLLMDLKMLTRKINLFVIDMIHEGFYLFIFDFVVQGWERRIPGLEPSVC